MAKNGKNDEPLDHLLQCWTVAASLPPRFNEQVWDRIVQGEAHPQPSWWQELRNLIPQLLPRPAFALAYVSILLVLGLTGGYLHAQTDSARTERMLAQRYAQSVAPYFVSQR